MMKKENKLRNLFVGWSIDNDNIIEMKLTCFACPVQFEGKLKDNNYFYYRERHDWARFVIAKTQKLAYRATEKEALYYVTYLVENLSPAVAAQDISKWVDNYFKRKKEEEASE